MVAMGEIWCSRSAPDLETVGHVNLSPFADLPSNLCLIVLAYLLASVNNRVIYKVASIILKMCSLTREIAGCTEPWASKDHKLELQPIISPITVKVCLSVVCTLNPQISSSVNHVLCHQLIFILPWLVLTLPESSSLWSPALGRALDVSLRLHWKSRHHDLIEAPL
jgi:hypothetical protein